MPPTTGQTLLSRGFAALKRVHPSPWALGEAEFTGVLDRVEDPNPENLDAPLVRLTLTLETADVPDGAVRGVSIENTATGLEHRIMRRRDNATTGQTVLWLAESGVEGSS